VNQSPDKCKEYSRREFLKQSMASGSAMVMMPTALSMILRQHEARAVECPKVSIPSSFPAFLVWDLTGGASLSGNWAPMGKNGEKLPSYHRLGMGKNPELDHRFGAPMAAGTTTTEAPDVTGSVSQFFQGFTTTLSAEASAHLRMGVICHEAENDTNINKHSAILHIAQAGFQGQLIRTPTSMAGTLSGGNTGSPLIDATLRPVKVGSFQEFVNAISYGPALDVLPESSLRALAKAAVNLSSLQAKRFLGQTLGNQFATLAQCGFLKNTEFTSKITGIDPRLDPILSSIYKIDPTTAATDEAVVRSTIVMNVLKGNSGPGVMVMTGYDYHDAPALIGDRRDFAAGVEIAKSIEAAYRMKRPLMFQILSDGGNTSKPNERYWEADDSGKTLTIVGYMNPNAIPEQRRTQIGYYTEAQVSNTSSLLNSDPTKVAHAVLANYLSVAGKMDVFSRVVSESNFAQAWIDGVLLF